MGNDKKVKYRNPNLLEGWEGSLIKIISESINEKIVNSPELHGPKTSVRYGDIAMFLEASPTEDEYSNYYSPIKTRWNFPTGFPSIIEKSRKKSTIDNRFIGYYPYVKVLLKDRVIIFNFDPQKWMYYFIPYPFGGFINP